MSDQTTITMSSGAPAHIHVGSTLRVEGRGWVEVITRSRTELEVISVGKFREEWLELGYAADAFLRELGVYRLLGWLDDRLWAAKQWWAR